MRSLRVPSSFKRQPIDTSNRYVQTRAIPPVMEGRMTAEQVEEVKVRAVARRSVARTRAYLVLTAGTGKSRKGGAALRPERD